METVACWPSFHDNPPTDSIVGFRHDVFEHHRCVGSGLTGAGSAATDTIGLAVLLGSPDAVFAEIFDRSPPRSSGA
ncbi:hypothetical protein HARCEL1_11965 [Halococcoides cellulosivorans]|uniref:Uncharacterized protein n=1 Tax=Halococcoides cellulosivorans TaxID=1679096 RepID=A0A2R4X3J6_9EURY|nr:hypothetical protein HARCEL1_11965 [Halococcoides cellulosivorans]